MAAAVCTLNSYTKTLIEMKHRARIGLEEARAVTHAPAYEDVVPEGASDGIYDVNHPLRGYQQGMLIDRLVYREDDLTAVMKEGMDHLGMVLVKGCGTQDCEDCEREMETMKDLLKIDGREEDDEICWRDGGIGFVISVYQVCILNIFTEI